MKILGGFDPSSASKCDTFRELNPQDLTSLTIYPRHLFPFEKTRKDKEKEKKKRKGRKGNNVKILRGFDQSSASKCTEPHNFFLLTIYPGAPPARICKCLVTLLVQINLKSSNYHKNG